MIYPFAQSPQLRTISKESEIEIPIVRNATNKFLLQYFDFLVFSEQAEQDLMVALKAGNQIIWKSGEFTVTGTGQINYPKDARQNFEGQPLRSISSCSSLEGQHDNFPCLGYKLPALFQANLAIVVFVKNQSDVFDHPIKIFIQGLFVS